MNDDLIGYGVGKLKDYGIVDSGDAKEGRRRRDERGALEGLLRHDGQGRALPADMDYGKAYTPQFVNKKVGMKP